MDPSDPALVELQLRFMKLERELTELSGIVAEQQRTIDALKVAARQWYRREADEQAAAPNEPPPHY